MNLILSLVALALGPLLYGAFQKNDFVRSGLDGLLFVTIAGLVIVHIVPDVYALAGITAMAFLLAGIAVAFLVDRHPTDDTGDSYRWIVLLGAVGLALHAAMDGIALLPGDHLHGFDPEAFGGHDHDHDHEHDHDHGPPGGPTAGLLNNHLAIGVILHRIPVGMAIWWAVRPRLGSAFAIGALAIIAVATSAAYLLGEPVIAMMEAKSMACFQAFVAGSLMHVIVFSSVRRDNANTEEQNANSIVGERLGVIAGLIIVFLVPHVH